MTKRAIAAVGTFGVLLTIGGMLFAQELTDREATTNALALTGDSATVRCQGSIVELDFDPAGHIEARAGARTLASADTESRRLSYDACTRTPTQSGWSQLGIHYASMKEPTTVTCRFPGRFFVHVHSVSPSWAGERPAGSAVYLVLGKRVNPGPGPQRTILASASVVERSDESSVEFARGYCMAS